MQSAIPTGRKWDILEGWGAQQGGGRGQGTLRSRRGGRPSPTHQAPTSWRPQPLPTGRKEGCVSCVGRSALHPASRGDWGAGVPSSVNAARLPSLPVYWGPIHGAIARLLLLTPAQSQHLGYHALAAAASGELPKEVPALPAWNPHCAHHWRPVPLGHLPWALVSLLCRLGRLVPRWVSCDETHTGILHRAAWCTCRRRR